MNHKYILVSILILIALAASAILAFEPLSVVCNVEQGCALVQNSIYAQTFEIKNSLFGVGIFSVLSILALSQIFRHSNKIEKFLKFSLFVGSAVAVYFLILQIFVLQAYCKYCIVVDLSTILALLVIYSPKKKINFI
ncbi:MAG: vitamin K epoxide reductase family protein [Nanoarchaeota archaeon]